MKKWTKFLLLGALTLSLAACGNDSSNPTTTSGSGVNSEQATGAISITDYVGNVHNFDQPPATIASLSPGDMDILLNLGANVTGRPTISYETTDEVMAIQEIGNPHEPSVEQIVALNPEVLVVPSSFKKFASTIESTGTEVVYSEANSIDEIKQSIEMFGTLYEAEDKAQQFIEEIDTKVKEASENATGVKTLLIYGAPGTYLTALNSSLSGDILNKAGGYNIANNFPESEKYPNYANLSVEKIVQAEPDVVMILTHSDPDAVVAGFKKQMETSSGWENLDAVKNDRIYILPADLFGNNPGTRITEALDYMINTLDEINAVK